MSLALDLRRVRSLAGAESRLLVRNRTALVNVILLPLGMVALFATIGGGDALGVTVLTMIACAGLTFVVYYTLITSLVARRQDLVLKRLKSGESPTWVIMTGMAVPLLIVLLAQLVLGIAAAAAIGDLSTMINPVLLPIALILGTATWTLLAIASTSFTRTVEAAQITTLPMIFVPLFLSGISIPLQFLPELLQQIAQFLPLSPVVELFRLGLTGAGADGARLSLPETFQAAIRPVLIMLGWIVVGAVWARRSFHWDPRR
ncbi:ABC transporter permease [Microlunatus speluncae]|uniref:ABC transporter permease n=1 Tax=Microlunatus speluncae TaxID=2594267 RepID=UPI0012661146|nr:ABC transporter permease [Microlunatus speluncae]